MAATAEMRPVLSEASNPRVQVSGHDSEFDLLVACCADSSGQEHSDRIRRILERPLDWERMLHLADHHRVVPQVYSVLAALPHLVPAQPLHALRWRYQDNARKALWFTAELQRILSHLESAGIQALPFKGPVLAKTLYGDVARRQFSDLDILILPEDVLKAKAALRALGYACSPELRQQEEPAYIASGCGYVFHSPAGRNLLDLQWRIVPRFYSIDFDVAGFLERASEISLETQEMEHGRPRPSRCVTSAMRSREAALEHSPRREPWVESEIPSSPSGAKDPLRLDLGCGMRTLCVEDLLLVLCVHAAKHVWVQLSWLCDIAQLIRSQQLDWNTIQDEAKHLGIERIVTLNLLLAHRLLGAPPQIQTILRHDTSATILADEIQSIIERGTHYDTETIPYFRLMMRLRERWQDRAHFLWRLVFTPSVSEWKAVRLPKPLQPLYRVVRLSRLAKRLAAAG
jgi:Uncharacterised nucleotidyltransferase